MRREVIQGGQGEGERKGGGQGERENGGFVISYRDRETQLHTATLSSLKSPLNFLGTSAQMRLDPWLWDRKNILGQLSVKESWNSLK